MKTLLYLEMHMWTSARVAKLISGASCRWWWLCHFAKLCHAFEEKNFFCHHNFKKKKIILSCLKTNLKISHKLRCLWKESKKRKLTFDRKLTESDSCLIKSLFWYLFKPATPSFCVRHLVDACVVWLFILLSFNEDAALIR